MNPFPCVWYGDPVKKCTCGNMMVRRYEKRISGPLLDRIGIHIEVPRVEYENLSDERLGEPSETIRARAEDISNSTVEVSYLDASGVDGGVYLVQGAYAAWGNDLGELVPVLHGWSAYAQVLSSTMSAASSARVPGSRNSIWSTLTRQADWTAASSA